MPPLFIFYNLSLSRRYRGFGQKTPGRKNDRPGLQACLKALQPGNTPVLWKLDRPGRGLKHLINTRSQWAPPPQQRFMPM